MRVGMLLGMNMGVRVDMRVAVNMRVAVGLVADGPADAPDEIDQAEGEQGPSGQSAAESFK